MDLAAYEKLVPNIGKVELNGAEVSVSWKCPVTGREVGRSAAMMVADPSIAGRVQASIKRSIASEMIYGSARLIAGLLGGAVGRVVSSVAYTAAGDINAKATAGADYTETSRRQAIVAAFEAVKKSFVWDEQAQRFVAQ
jgi:hypothetical protein